MTFVSDELIEKTWRKMGAFDASQIQKLQKRHQKSQKALTIFVCSFLEEFEEEAFGVMLFTYHVIVEAFENAKPRPKRVSKPQIDKVIEYLEANESGSIFESIARSPEPFALKYAYEALAEVDDVELSDSDIAAFLSLHEIVIECLNRACLK